MNNSKLYIKAAFGTHCFEVEDVKGIHSKNIQLEESNGFHAAFVAKTKISEKDMAKFKQLVDRLENKRR